MNLNNKKKLIAKIIKSYFLIWSFQAFIFSFKAFYLFAKIQDI